jgi:cytoskeletal protein RodZ
MPSKDQSIGGFILIVCVVVGILYTLGLFYFGGVTDSFANWSLPLWLIGIPVFIAFIAIMAIGAWIGWTMATTPPPKPIEELTTEKEEPKEETPPAPSMPSEPETKTEEVQPSTQEKRPERRRKGEQ